jgi:hypothetical protein
MCFPLIFRSVSDRGQDVGLKLSVTRFKIIDMQYSEIPVLLIDVGIASRYL